LEQSSFSEFDKAVRVITGQMVTSEPTTDMPVKVQAATLKKRTKNKPEEGQRPRKAAFTLRLDPERHLRLRLLSAYSNRSSQQLVLEALDRLLENNATLIGCDTGLR
jgi:predicted HicB family RNase H-like nuclease